jgi:hypothetical protein
LGSNRVRRVGGSSPPCWPDSLSIIVS